MDSSSSQTEMTSSKCQLPDKKGKEPSLNEEKQKIGGTPEKTPATADATVAMKSSKEEEVWPPKEDTMKEIEKILYGPSQKKRLPVFVKFCPD